MKRVTQSAARRHPSLSHSLTHLLHSHQSTPSYTHSVPGSSPLEGSGGSAARCWYPASRVERSALPFSRGQKPWRRHTLDACMERSALLAWRVEGSGMVAGAYSSGVRRFVGRGRGVRYAHAFILSLISLHATSLHSLTPNSLAHSLTHAPNFSLGHPHSRRFTLTHSLPPLLAHTHARARTHIRRGAHAHCTIQPMMVHVDCVKQDFDMWDYPVLVIDRIHQYTQGCVECTLESCPCRNGFSYWSLVG